jgi:cell division protein FtsI/penicillin-binding protein 2
MQHIFFKRLIHMLILLFLLLLLLASRLAYIQLIGTETFSKHNVNLIKNAIHQRQQQIVLHTGRGEITDRNGSALTGHSTHVLVLFPLLKTQPIEEEKIQEVARIVGVYSENLLYQIKELKDPTILTSLSGIVQLSEEEANEINELKIQGVLGLPYELRYDLDKLVGQHFIGYIGQNPEYIRNHYFDELKEGTLREDSVIGISGIEKTFQPFLQGVGPISLSYYVDAKGNPLQGMDIKYSEQGNPFYPLIIQTTLDKDLQTKLEQVMDAHLVKEGTAVILDTETSEVLAMVNRPNFSNQLATINAWENKALKRFSPGSVFKIVIAAAAMEEEKVKLGEKFRCDGELEGTNFHCWLKEGHGDITFEEGFAQSCNIVFGKLAQELGPDLIEEYASKLGLLEQNGWQEDYVFHIENFKQLDQEENGQIFSTRRTNKEKSDPLYLLQTGIGQLDVQVTPIAVANMMATITKGGNKHQVKGVRDILYQTGGSFYHFAKKRLDEPDISAYTAYQLQMLLAGVVDHGTAKSIKNTNWEASGKTGTAQVVVDHITGNQPFKNHKWFAGIYPRQKPRYSIVVLTLNQPEDSRNMSLSIFADLVEWLDQNR